MSDDNRRERQRPAVRSRATLVGPSVITTDRASSSRQRVSKPSEPEPEPEPDLETATFPQLSPNEGEPLSRSRIAVEVSVRALDAPPARSESHIAVESHERAPHPDSVQPVRVSLPAPALVPPATRPSFWSRSWAGAALVFVIAGGLIGIWASLRLRALDAGRAGESDAHYSPSPASHAAQRAVEPAPASKPHLASTMGPAIPVPSLALAPVVPFSSALIGRSINTLPVDRGPAGTPSAARTVDPEVGKGAGLGANAGVNTNNNADRVIVSSTGRHMTTGPSTSRNHTADTVKNIPPVTVLPDEPVVPAERSVVPTPSPAPAAPSAPETPGTSEAWVTEERRF